MSHKLHNPKSHAPAVYIPCWLIQISIKLLSHGAKMTYGRLSQWASSNGTVYRSVPQLAQELGCSERSIEEYLKELRAVVLIGTYHPQAGGVNHYEFYDHPWMHDPIKDQLVYKQDKFTPPHYSVAPPTPECGTPPHPSVDINNKEIKEIKCVGASAAHTQNDSKKSKKEKSEEMAVEDQEVKDKFEKKFFNYDLTIEKLFALCKEHYEQKGLWCTKERFLKWIDIEKFENHKKKITNVSNRDSTRPSVTDFQEYAAGVKGFEFVGEWISKQERLKTK